MIFRNMSLAAIVLALELSLFCGCGRRQTMVEIADRIEQYRVGNGGEPADLDPQIAIGQLEHDVMLSLFEGLVYGDAKDVSPRPGVAESWDISPDGLVYTFHLRKNARWSNGDPVTARDFYESYHRMLLPSLAAQYSYMLYPVTNAEAFNNGQITNFNQVGFKALDDYTLRITARSDALSACHDGA
jgi:oligopeptide transport system substrate-binding protein